PALPSFPTRRSSDLDVLDDDGAEIRRRFEIEARLNGWCRRFAVTADAFAGLGWVTEHLGARAIVYPGLGLRDHARAAMQVLSGRSEEHTSELQSRFD